MSWGWMSVLTLVAVVSFLTGVYVGGRLADASVIEVPMDATATMVTRKETSLIKAKGDLTDCERELVDCQTGLIEVRLKMDKLDDAYSECLERMVDRAVNINPR